MSSLLQFRGTMSRRGVDLQFTLCKVVDKIIGDPQTLCGPLTPEQHSRDGRAFILPEKVDIDTFIDPETGRPLPFIWIATRKPCGMLGCWVVFRYNGEEHVPDLSIPIRVERIPRGARKLSQEESLKIWKN